MSGSFQTSHHQLSTSARPYFSTECANPLVDELAPLRVVLRRIRPAGVDVVVVVARASSRADTAAACRQRLRHEADLDERLHLALDVGVEDAIDDRPVVDRPAVRVFGVGVGRSPLEGGRAVARRQQVVREPLSAGTPPPSSCSPQGAPAPRPAMTSAAKAASRRLGSMTASHDVHFSRADVRRKNRRAMAAPSTAVMICGVVDRNGGCPVLAEVMLVDQDVTGPRRLRRHHSGLDVHPRQKLQHVARSMAWADADRPT